MLIVGILASQLVRGFCFSSHIPTISLSLYPVLLNCWQKYMCLLGNIELEGLAL